MAADPRSFPRSFSSLFPSLFPSPSAACADLRRADIPRPTVPTWRQTWPRLREATPQSSRAWLRSLTSVRCAWQLPPPVGASISRTKACSASQRLPTACRKDLREDCSASGSAVIAMATLPARSAAHLLMQRDETQADMHVAPGTETDVSPARATPAVLRHNHVQVRAPTTRLVGDGVRGRTAAKKRDARFLLRLANDAWSY